METTNTAAGAENTSDLVNEEAKRIAIISYITIIGLVIAFVMNNEKQLDFAKYHIRQSLGLCVTGFGLGIIGLIPILGWIINLLGIFVLLYMWIMALMNALNGRTKPAPFLGSKFNEWFKGL
ncbi:DUF4870 domain-containing protein [Euzebyella saccharophila]|uniref:DUF4870 domain-containing protein n=1 Tax=Euzebyella saccharophila TaxID=679664 RepID=A0ABV8JQ15_9FLAO|nr:hypothetical protein [Euzebyella saccharophila]